MPRTPVTWSSAPFNWPAQPELDEKSLNSPQPCQHGSKCTYKKEGACCAFVHPGEQGTGRVFFPARTVDADGKQIYQKAAVRLIGSSFYERRRLGLSWPEWCAKKGQKAAPTQPQVLQGPIMIANGMVQQVPSAQQMQQMASFFQAFQYAQSQMQQQAYAQQQAAYAAQQAEAEAVLASQNKQTLGCRIFAKVEPKLEAMKKAAAYSDETEEAMVWPSNMTAGKLTGMFLEGMEVGELQELLKDEAFFDDRFNEALGILHDHWENVLKQGTTSVAADASLAAM